MQLQLHYTNYTTPQLQLHYTTTTTTAALHHTTSSSCGWGDRPGDHCNHCSHSKKHSSNHLSVHQWIRSAIRDSQQPISPIDFLFWNFRHRLVRYLNSMKVTSAWPVGFKFWSRPLWTPQQTSLSLRPARALITWKLTAIAMEDREVQMPISSLL